MLNIDSLNPRLLKTSYAVRGPIVNKALEMQRQGKDIIFCNIGNPQSLGQKPLTYIRQVLSLLENPELPDKDLGYPKDIIKLARDILKEDKGGIGTYTESAGLEFVRKAVADFISQRDGIPSDHRMIHLTDGASKAVQNVLLSLISDEDSGIMIPVPQYPLYSATIDLHGGKKVLYSLDEDRNWELSKDNLERAYDLAVNDGVNVKAIVVINPGNPTGGVLNYDNIRMIVGFAKEHGLAILADEVYQENIHINEKFHSFARVMDDLKLKLPLFSFHSVSKGFLGECGHRGGYVEYRNIPGEVADELLKMQAISLCSNHPGQIAVYLMVRPPRKGEESYDLYVRERDAIKESLKRRAKLLAAGLNKIRGISCQEIQGAMYAFPRIELPSGMDDDEYCLKLLEKTGICVVPGSGFGQKEGTHHFRTTILPPEEKMMQVVEKLKGFHEGLMKK
jgi:aspartate/methionine/tyrosine aminotransferase